MNKSVEEAIRAVENHENLTLFQEASLRKSLKNSNKSDQIEAISALSKIQDQQAIPLLIKKLADPYSPLRIAARKALDSINPYWFEEPLALKHIPWLLRQVSKKNEEINPHVIDALVKLGEPIESIQPPQKPDSTSLSLNRAVMDRQESRTKKIFLKKNLRELRKKLENGTYSERLTVIMVMGELRNPHAIGDLIRLTVSSFNDDAFMSQAILKSLTEIDKNWAQSQWALDQTQWLQDKLSDENVSIRQSAALKLGEIGDTQSIGSLIRLITDDSSAVWEAASNSLDTIFEDWRHHPVAKEQSHWLQESLRDKGTSQDVEVRIVKILGDLRNHESIDILVSFLDSQHELTRSACESSLLAISLRWQETPAAKKKSENLRSSLDSASISSIENETLLARIWALGALHDLPAIPYLLRFLKFAKNMEVEEAVSSTVRKIALHKRNSEAFKLLLPDIRENLSSSKKANRLLGIYLTEILHDPLAIYQLILATGDPDIETSLSAKESLNSIYQHCKNSQTIKAQLPEIRNSLTSKNHGILRSAHSFLANVRDEASIGLLIQTLINRDENIRKSAEIALRKIDTKWEVHPLTLAEEPWLVQQLESENALTRTLSLKLLGIIGSTHSLLALVSLAAEKNPKMIALATDASNAIVARNKSSTNDDYLPGLLKPLLGNPSESIRLAAVKLACQFCNRNTAPFLTPLLTDQSVEVREAAKFHLMEILENWESNEATLAEIPRIRGLLAANDLDKKKIAVTLLAELRDIESFESIFQLLEDERMQLDAKQALTQLISKNSKDLEKAGAVNVLLDALHHNSHYKKSFAILALKSMPSTRALEPLIKTLFDIKQHHSDHNAAKQTIDHILNHFQWDKKCERELHYIFELLFHDKRETRNWVLCIIERWGDPSSTAYLIRALADPHHSISEQAEKLLNEINPEWRATASDQLPWLREKLDDNTCIYTQRSAAIALGQLRDSGAISFLTKKLSDSSTVVSDPAFLALNLINPEWYKSPEAKKQLPWLEASLESADGALSDRISSILSMIKAS